MPIKFHCPSCHQMLGIARRKAGTVVSCPRCSYPATVPGDDDAESRAAVSRGDRPAFERRDFERWIGFDDDGPSGGSHSSSTAVAEPPRPPVHAPAPAPAAPPSAALTSSQTSTHPVPARLRSANYEPSGVDVRLVGALILGFSLISFGGGYFVGRNSSFQRPTGGQAANNAKWAPNKEAARAEDIPTGTAFSVSGRVQYKVGNDVFPDAGSRVIAFPTSSQKPTRKLNYQGLRPGDDGGLDQSGVEGVKKLGGAVATVGEDGSYSMELRKPGAYWVVVLSKNAQRPGEISLLPEEQKLADYFADLPNLLGKREFTVVIRRVAEDTGKKDGPGPHAALSPMFTAAAPSK